MIESLKFVMGAVSTGPKMLPEFTHFQIKDGVVRGHNGTMTLSSPIDFNVDCKPKAALFVQAIDRCDKSIEMRITEAGRLAMQSGGFKAFIECHPGEIVGHPDPDGEQHKIDGTALLDGLKKLLPVVSEDGYPAWANGILLRDGALHATCNTVFVKCQCDEPFPVECNIPKSAIREMLRIGEPPHSVQCDDQILTFHYSDGRYLQTTLLSAEWPKFEHLLDDGEYNGEPLTDAFFDALDMVKPFLSDYKAVYCTETGLATSLDEGDGAAFEIPGMPAGTAFNHDLIYLLKDLAETIDFRAGKDIKVPILFRGKNLHGALAKMIYKA